MRILHIADLHLDRPFVALPPSSASRRRGELRSALERCLGLARDERVDAVTIAGDLWEDEHVTGDTRNFVAGALARLAPTPVLIVAGNHDPLLPGGNYRRTAWPANVHVFESGQPQERRLPGGVSVWGVSWGGGRLSADFLDSFATPAGGPHLLLLHGTAAAHDVFGGGERYCPFDPALARRAGFAHVLCGHIHAGGDGEGVLYPGSPEPLSAAETGRHCAGLVELAGADVAVTLLDVARSRYETRSIDCAGCESSADIAERLAVALPTGGDAHAYLTVRLTGEVAPECVVDPGALAEPHRARFGALSLLDDTRPRYDLDAIARQLTARGRFVRSLLAEIEAAGDDERALVLREALLAGLRALDGQAEVLHVDL